MSNNPIMAMGERLSEWAVDREEAKASDLQKQGWLGAQRAQSNLAGMVETLKQAKVLTAAEAHKVMERIYS